LPVSVTGLRARPVDSCSKLHADGVTQTLESIYGKIRTFLLDGSQALL
jgi:hypothetical protein